MLTPAHHVAVLGVDSNGVVQVILLSPDGDSSIAHTFKKSTSTSYGGIAYALFDPAASGDQDEIPWQRGDILVSRSTASDRPQRAIVRLRPRRRMRRFVGYEEQVIYAGAGAAIQGLAFDPHGRLYAAQADAKRIYRLQMGSSGKLEEIAWMATPPRLQWKGDFGFSPDGMLFLSSGEGDATGQVYKFSVGGDPRPGPASIQPITYRAAYTARGEIRGFSFFDNDSLLFTDARDAYYRSKINPALDPTSQPAGPFQPVFPGPVIASLAIRYSDRTLENISVIDIAVMRTAWQSYLEQHQAVRAAISWSPEQGRSLHYAQWTGDAQTASMERRLHRMYGWIAARESAPLAYRWQTDPLTGSARIGPEILQAWGTIGKHDAEDGYLAFLAHCLWMQVHNKVPWNLHDYSAAHLELLLDGANLFRPSNTTGDRFNLNEDVVVNTMPSDPVVCFAFLTGSDSAWRDGPSFIQGTRRETILSFTRWVMDHLTHGSNPSNSQGVTYYGYNGYPPVETMLRRMIDPGSLITDPRYWTWQGCHTSAGLMVHLMRLLLIPAGRTKLYDWWAGQPEPGYHGGVDFPTEQLACLHTDQFYAMPVLMDPYLPPEEIYNGGPDESYSGYLTQYGSIPADAQAAGVNMTAFLKQEAIIAARNGTNRVMKAFWGQDLVNNPIPDNRPCEQKYWNAALELSSFGLTTTEAAQLLCDNEQKYLDFIANFRAEHAAELPTGGDEKQQLQAAFSLYQQLHDAWMAAR